MKDHLLTRYFLWTCALLCLLYLGFELFYNAYSMISVDEFWFAHRIYQYQSGLPYRDFSPYKTVLGYYLLLLPMLASHGILSTLIFTKNIIALFNAGIFFACSWKLKRYFKESAVLVSLALLLSSETVLAYSTNIRVDLLAYWFCIFSFLFLLEKRFMLAGLILGLGFLTSQKAIWYLFASDLTLGIYWLTFSRQSHFIWQIIKFNLITFLTIAMYLIVWSYLTDWQTVFHNVFIDASAMYQLDWYDASRKIYWHYIVLYNPLLFLLWPLTLISLFITYPSDTQYSQRFFTIIYACTLLCCLIPYKQVFPYYMQVTIPVFLCLYAAFFHWLFAIYTSKEKIQCLIAPYYLQATLGIYIAGLMSIVIYLQLPAAYLLLIAIPVSISCLLSSIQINQSALFLKITGTTLLFVGLIYPTALFSLKMSVMDGQYQKANIQAINTLLQDGNDYVAGIELIYNKNQPIAGLRHLMGPAIDYLYAPSDKIRPVMLASLYEDPNVTQHSVIQALRASAVKFYVNNYRMMALPESIKSYLASQYEHLWGSIYFYGPLVDIPHTIVVLKFSGNYLIETNHKGFIQLSGKKYATNSVIHLNKGPYISQADFSYRLKLQPDQPLSFNPHFEQDEWIKMIF